MRDDTAAGIWGRGDAYERYVGRWSRRVAPVFLSWLAVRSGRRWLDVGCGTGALCEAIARHTSPVSIVGVDPAEGFVSTARHRLAGRADILAGSAENLPLPDSSIDVVVSGLVLNFVPDAPAALAEMARVARRNGILAAYVWDYGERMELMRHFWDAAVDLDPAATTLAESNRFALCNPAALRTLFDSASLADVDVTAIDIATEFTDFDDYWEPFLGGQGPAPAYAMSLDPSRRQELRERIRTGLPVQADGSIALIARAWAVRGTVV